MIAAQQGGCNAAVDYTTRRLTMPKEDGSGHAGEKDAGPSAQVPSGSAGISGPGKSQASRRRGKAFDNPLAGAAARDPRNPGTRAAYAWRAGISVGDAGMTKVADQLPLGSRLGGNPRRCSSSGAGKRRHHDGRPDADARCSSP